ncbi:MAG TPA: shikimate kinase [Planctomycetaceae bacterium]|nr:shikimate kinase [Planctomycetaceae bacterium]
MKLTLIGYRGCGKSSVGPLLAETLRLTCIDSDDHVEDAAGKSIQQIFADDGEAEFRRLESQVIADLLAQDDIVVAAGGGAILAETNRKCMQDAGSVIWLQATVETLASRIARDETSTSRRPSLTGKSIQEEIAEVLEARRELYQKASTMTVDTDNRAPQEIADEIVTRLAGVSE